MSIGAYLVAICMGWWPIAAAVSVGFNIVKNRFGQG